MAEVKKDTHCVPIREMNRKQMKEHRKAGFDPVFGAVNGEKNANMVEWILDNVYKDCDLDEHPYHELVVLEAGTLRLSMGGPAAIRN